MLIKPLGDRILVKAIEAEEKTKGGIVVPDTARTKPQEGKVLDVGEGKLLEDGTVRKLEVKKGDIIIYGRYSGTEITYEGEEYLILTENDVLAVKK